MKSEGRLKAPKGTCAKLFFAALVIRWGYALILYLTMNDTGLMGVDSSNYLPHTQTFASEILAGSVSGWKWLGLDPFIMPLVTWMIAINIFLFGNLASLTYVLFQGVLDSATCLFTYGIALQIDRRIALPAAVAAVINPTQIVLSGLIYTDTPFLFFVAIFLFGSARWLRCPSWHSAITIGLGVSGAAMCRIAVALWVPALLSFLIIVLVAGRRLKWKHLMQLATAGAIFSACVGSLALRNFSQYSSWALTPQEGMHLNWWVVPLVLEARDGTPWVRGLELMQQRTRDRFGPRSENPFIESKRETEVALDELKNIGPLPIIKAWMFGGAINLGAPAVILSPPVSLLPRTGFYGTVASNLTEKIFIFLFHSDNPTYAWIMMLGLFGVFAFRVLQLFGVVSLIKSAELSIVFLCAGWCLYILMINGPVASPKYRLPIEPVLCVLTGAGWCFVRRLRNTPRSEPTTV